MYFVSLVKFRRSLTKEDYDRVNGVVQKWVAKGNKIHKVLFTLGGYDQVWFWESENEKSSLQSVMEVADLGASETMAAVDREEVLSWQK